MTNVLNSAVQAVESQPHAWAGSIADFLAVSTPILMDGLASHLTTSLLLTADDSQLNAWRDELKVLHREFSSLMEMRPESKNWSLILEYELPRERGRRPDVIILAGDKVIVLEFKGMREATKAAIDQAAAYKRDIESYHLISHDRRVFAGLVLTRSNEGAVHKNSVYIVGGTRLAGWLFQLNTTADPSLTVDAWLQSPYTPLPSLVSAARRIFNHEPLPSIRRAQSAGIPATIAALERAADEASESGGRHLALVTGVPGAGKTLVGLQFVYATRHGASDNQNDAVFLSGNGPLVKVLQHALRSSVFVQDVHGFLRDYGGSNDRLPREHIWVYDEAQRAWDANRVREKRGHGYSEPEDFIRLGERTGDWAMVVGLIGEGQ